MITKNINDEEFYVPHYETAEEIDSMLNAYESYQKGNYKLLQPDDWKKLTEVCIIWRHNDTISITHPQSPTGRDFGAWLAHIYTHTKYYIGYDKSGFEYMVFVK